MDVINWVNYRVIKGLCIVNMALYGFMVMICLVYKYGDDGDGDYGDYIFGAGWVRKPTYKIF